MVGQRKIIFLVLLLSFIACGKTAEQEAQELLYKFEKDAARFSLHVDTDRVKVEFLAAVPEGNIGECWLAEQKIVLLRSWWGQISLAEQEVLLYHELGHCMLGRPHRSGPKGPEGFPASIMYWQLVPGFAYERHRDYYVKELFQGG